MSNSEAMVNLFYLGYYGRPADPDGLAFWSSHLDGAAGDFGAIAQAFAISEEATIRFGAADTATRIGQIYQHLFGRAPDSDGLGYWTNAIAQGHMSLADAAVQIAGGALGGDASLLALRQQAVEHFTAEVEKSGVAYEGYAAIEAARVLVKAVGAQASEADIAAMVAATARLVDIAHDKPNVVTAIATGTTLVALFDTARGQAEPVNLVLALADVAQAAAGDPATLESLLRGGGMAKVLQVMPQKATLHDVVEALATGGLPAAVEVVYPSAPGGTPAPVLRLAFVGVEQGSGDTQPNDNVTNVKEAKVEFSHAGRALAGGERYEYSLDGTEWTANGLTTSTVNGRTVISVVVDLAEGTPIGASARAADAHADLGTKVSLRVIDAADKTVASVSQAIVYDSYAAAPVFTLDTDPASLHFGQDLHHVRDVQAIGIGSIETGGRIEYAVHAAGKGAEPAWTVDVPEFEEGTNTVEVRQVDAAGNISRSESLTFTLDSKAPEAPTVALQEDTGIDAHDGVTSNARVLIDGLDTLPTTGWEYSTDGKEWTFGGVNDGSGKAVFDAAVLGERSVALQVRQIDAAGNVSGADAIALTYDKTAPTETLAFRRIEGEPDGVAITTQPQAGITFAVTGKADGIVEWRFKGDAAWTALGEADYNGDGSFTLADVDLAQADPTIELRVIDAAGNPGATLSQLIDGPHVKPFIKLTATRDGLQLESPVAGAVQVGSAPARSDDQGQGAIVGTVTLGEQLQQMQGTVSVTPQDGAPITDGSLDIYGLGTAGGNKMSGSNLWGFGGADELTGTDGADYLNGGDGADIIDAGGGRDTIVGDAGADVIRLGKDGVPDLLVYAPGDTMDSVFASGGSVAAMDRIEGAEQGDVFQLGDVFSAAPTIGSAFLTSAAANHVAVVRGTYASGAFTAGASGTSYLLQWADGSHINSVLLANYGIQAPTLAFDGAAGTLTLDASLPFGATLTSVGLSLLGATNTATFNIDGAQLAALDNAATFVLSDYASGAATPTPVDYTAAPGFGVDDGVLSFSEPLHAGLYQMNWQDDTFATDSGYLKAGSFLFAGGSDGLFHFEGVKIHSVYQAKSGGIFDSTNNTAFLVAAINDLNTPYIVSGGGHDVYVKQIRSMNIAIENEMKEGDSDLVLNFESGIDKVTFNYQVALELDQDYNGKINWATQAGQDGRLVIGSSDEGGHAVIDGAIRIGGADTSSIVSELNKVFDVSQVARGAKLVFLVDDGGIGDGAALFHFTNKNGDAHIDADEVTTLMMFADGVPDQVDIIVVGTV